MRHLLSIEDLDRDGDRAHLSTAPRRFAEVADREIKKVPALRGRTVLNLFYEASTRTRSLLRARRQAPERRRRELRRQRLERREGRVAEGHGPDARRPQARRDRHPHAVGRRRRAGRRLDAAPRSSTPATASTSTRRRRCSTSTRCAAASAASTARSIWIVGDVAALARRALEHPRLPDAWARRSRVVGPPTLIPRGIEALGCEVRYTSTTSREADVVYALRMQHERMDQAWVPSLREYAALLPDQRPPPAPAPGAHAPRPGQPRRRAVRRGRRLAAGGHHRPGRGRRRRPDGGALRAARRRRARGPPRRGRGEPAAGGR